MVVQAPVPVILGQVRVSGVRCEKLIEAGRGGVQVARVEGKENLAQPLGQCNDARGIALAERRKGRVDVEDRLSGEERILELHRPTEGVIERELVDQMDGDDDPRVFITVEPQLISHCPSGSVVTDKLVYASYELLYHPGREQDDLMTPAALTTASAAPTAAAPTAAMLRQAAEADIEAIAALWHSGWSDGHLGYVPTALLPHRRLDDFRRRVPTRLDTTTVATIDAEIVGFVTTHHDEIEQLYVDAAARGTGIAAALLGHGETIIRTQFDRAWLAVVAGNARARRFYERNGWYDTGSFDYPAFSAGDTTISVPAHRYEKRLTSLVSSATRARAAASALAQTHQSEGERGQNH